MSVTQAAETEPEAESNAPAEPSASVESAEAPSAQATESASGPTPEAPMGFVRDGTSTAAHDNEMARRWADAETRRDAELGWSRLAEVPLEAGGAAQYTHKLTRNPEVPAAYVLLHYVNRAGQKVPPGECCADILQENPNDPLDLTLQFFCPRCYNKSRHWQECIIKMQQSKKPWQLAAGQGSPTFLFNEGYGPKMYHSAGMVVASERFDCPQCGYRARIDHDRIWPD